MADCPDACNIRLGHLEDDMKAIEQCLATFKRDLAVRPKTPTIVAVAVIAVGVLGAILGSLWQDLGSVDAKVDLIREDQVKVMTTLEIHVDETNNGNSHAK